MLLSLRRKRTSGEIRRRNGRQTGEDGDGPKFDPQSEDFQAAEDACGDLLGAMRPGSGTNVAPGGGDSGAGLEIRP